jgi:SAM-dependent methyltransferase
MRRRAKALDLIDRTMRVIELGPLDKPVVAKRDGWNSFVVDRATREELVRQYAAHPNVDVNRLEAVDAVWTSGPLDAVIPTNELGKFDACIASHVIEHVPDPIGLFRSLQRVLQPKGLVSLVVPDKRFCFDFFKPLSSVGELLSAHEAGAGRHSHKTRFDYDAYTITSAGEICWSRRPVTDVAFVTSLRDAKRAIDGQHESAETGYVDLHAWHFTPSSFELAVLELGYLDEIDFQIARLHPTVGCEFHVTLRRGRPILHDDQLNARRLQLLRAILFEVREQADLLDGKQPLPRRLRSLGRRIGSRVRAMLEV